MSMVEVLNGHVIQRQTSSVPHIIDAQGLAAVLLLQGSLARLVSSIPLGIRDASTQRKREYGEGSPDPMKL